MPVEPALAVLSLLAAASAWTCIAADLRGDLRRVYVAKPLTMVFVIAIALLSADAAEPFYRNLLLLGLVLSLAGDVFLMLPGDRFVAGLGSFLLAHLCYIAAFTSGIGFGGPLLALAPIGIASGFVLSLIWRGAAGQRGPVLAYVAAIAVMGWQALARWLEIGDSASALACAGAFAFIFSDSMLAINRFRAPLAWSPVLVLGSYFPAQWLIALSMRI